MIPCGEESASCRSGTAGEEREWVSCFCREEVEALSTVCDGGFRRRTPSGKDAASPDTSALDAVTAAWHKLIGMDLEVVVKPDRGIEGGEVVCLVLTDTGALVGVGCRLLNAPRAQLTGSGENCMDFDDSDNGDVIS